MRTFNSDVLGRLAVAVDLANARADVRPAWVFEGHGYLPPDSDADWDEVMAVAADVDDLLRLVAAGDHESAVSRVNGWLRSYRVSPYVEPRNHTWVLHFHASTASFADGWAGGIAAALAVTYGNGEPPRVGHCGAAECARLFLDRGRNQQRRFCSLRCQNRSKSAAYRHRRG